MEDARNCGPYKATKMWNEMVETFRNGIPLKRHRRHIKVYDNCFTGQEAVNWFQSVLQNSFHRGKSVMREQTIQLLNKFLKAGVFQNINAESPFDIHYQFLKEGDLYCLSDVSSTRLPLTIKSLNIPPKSKLNQWSVENKDGVPNKSNTTAHRQPEIAEPRLDAHYTATTRSSKTQPSDGNSNHHMSQNDFTRVLPLPNQHIRNKNYVQYGTNYRGAGINQMYIDYGTLQTSAWKDSGHENYTNSGIRHCRHGASEHHSTQNVSAGENQPTGTSGNYNVGHYFSSAEHDKMCPGGTKANSHLRSEKTSICSPFNSKDSKDLNSPTSFMDSCKWLQPHVFDSIDTCDMKKRICVEQPHTASSTALDYKHPRISTTLPRHQMIQRSLSMIQPKLDLSKTRVPTNHDSGKSLHNENLPQESTQGNGLIKPHYNISSATVSRNPCSNVYNSAFTAENSIDQCVLYDGKQIHCYPAPTSQWKSNQNNVTGAVMQKERTSFSTSGSLGFPRLHADEPITSTVPELRQPFEIGEIWKKVILARFQKHTPGLEVPFSFYLQSIPCEWLTANASSEVHSQHDSQFPQSLVAAMNCLVHWPHAVPNDIITTFKEHYFKLKQPLITFKLYSILTKVFLYVATGNLAMNKDMVLRQSRLNVRGPPTMKLPPNSCFETAFTSDSPVTRIVPQSCVDTLHFSQHGQQPKNIPPKRISSAPNLCEPLADIQAAEKRSSHSGRRNCQIIVGRRSMKLSNKKASKKARIGMDEDRTLCHLRNKSGGYVNPALSKSIDDIVDTDDFVGTARMHSQHSLEAEQELDYVAALESLNTLMRYSRQDNPSVSIGGKGADSDGNQSSESSSYYTAVSSSSSEASSRRNSVLVDSLENVNAGGMVHMNIGESEKKLMVAVMQLLLLCIPADNRVQLRYLLQFMDQWNLHHSLCVQTDVVDIFTSTILCSECEANIDVTLSRSIVYFLVSHHELVLSIPSDLVAEVHFLVTRQHTDNVSHKGGNMTYCQQVSSRQFEHQRLTGSQLALSELLEQILSDCKMGPKEKRKRLKMFQDAYPHIYRRRFPDPVMQDKDVKKQSRGLLNLATLSRLKSMRV